MCERQNPPHTHKRYTRIFRIQPVKRLCTGESVRLCFALPIYYTTNRFVCQDLFKFFRKFFRLLRHRISYLCQQAKSLFCHIPVVNVHFTQNYRTKNLKISIFRAGCRKSNQKIVRNDENKFQKRALQIRRYVV